jgi:hypothetical protein
MVGDRGMLTSARIERDLTPEGIDWISALRSTQVRKLVEGNVHVVEKESPASMRRRWPASRSSPPWRTPR